MMEQTLHHRSSAGGGHWTSFQILVELKLFWLSFLIFWYVWKLVKFNLESVKVEEFKCEHLKPIVYDLQNKVENRPFC